MTKKLQVTKTYLPSKEKFLKYIDEIWESHVITNNGTFLKLLEEKLGLYSGCNEVLACANGTLAIQLALRAMNITKEVITTPFSYVATTHALLWEHCTPVFVDVNKKDFTIDTDKIESAITKDTEAILATHVYGYPCDVEKIRQIADKHGLKVIYDAANAFGTSYRGKSIFRYGDISICSFHATKLFHSGEGGALFINREEYSRSLFLFRSFGHIHDDHFSIGINAKMSELHAALGLCVLEDIDMIIKKRKEISQLYDALLDDQFKYMPAPSPDISYNYAYYPVLLRDEEELNAVVARLNNNDVLPRRYFYPSLNTLPFLDKVYQCPVSENIASRVICLPLSHYTTENETRRICDIINSIKRGLR